MSHRPRSAAIRPLALTLTIALLVTGCSFIRTAHQQPLEKTDLTVAAVPAIDSAGFLIALKQGLFSAEGLHVTFVPATSSETVIADQMKGKYDITAGNYVSYIQAQENHAADLRIVAEGSVMMPGSQAIYTMPGSQIKTLADLVGKTVGVDAPKNICYLLIASALEQQGIPVSKVHFESFPFPSLASDLQEDIVQAAELPEPFASIGEQGYGLTQLADLNLGSAQDFPIEGYVVTKQWARLYPHTLAAFLSALHMGQEIADSDRGAVEQAMESLPDPYSVTPTTASVMAVNTYPLGLDTGQLQRVADVMHQFIGAPAFDIRSMLGDSG
jgi:NitT/TauT family transport system substrate-binding protein